MTVEQQPRLCSGHKGDGNSPISLHTGSFAPSLGCRWGWDWAVAHGGCLNLSCAGVGSSQWGVHAERWGLRTAIGPRAAGCICLLGSCCRQWNQCNNGDAEWGRRIFWTWKGLFIYHKPSNTGNPVKAAPLPPLRSVQHRAYKLALQ